MKFLLMGLGCYSLIAGMWLDSTAIGGNPVALMLGCWFGITLIFGAIVLAIAKK